jgi:hypothetical protein
MKKPFTLLLLTVTLFGSTGCFYSKTADMFSPFRDPGPPDEHLGDTSNKTILEETGGSSTGGNGSQASNARAALEVMATYRQAQDPQPTYPVLQPAEVRLMWVPDHTNKVGDLVPAHYYYLKLLEERWAVQDAFDLESQLNKSTSGPGGNAGATPWVYGEPNKK